MLLTAINATFKNRETPVPAQEFEALTSAFVEAHRVQWNAFVKKIGADELIDEFARVVADIRKFAMPALESLARGEQLAQKWKAADGWVTST